MNSTAYIVIMIFPFQIVTIPTLYCVETIDSTKLATRFNNLLEKVERNDKLKVMVQINTSQEERKLMIRYFH